MYSNSKCNKFLMYFIFIIFLFCSCQTFYPKNSPEFSFIENSEKNFVWEKLTEGIFLSHIKYEDYPLIVHAVKIDLTNPKLKIVVTEPDLFNDKGLVKREGWQREDHWENFTFAQEIQPPAVFAGFRTVLAGAESVVWTSGHQLR